MKDKKAKLIVIIGPTAVGKTKLSVELARKLNGEIISGDSMQIYRGMDIGTAKIKPEEMNGVPHHLIDIKEPDESFSAAEFQARGRQLVEEIHNRNRMPVVAGGTGLYIQSLIYDYHFSELPSHPEIRQKLEELAEQQGINALYEELERLDPESAKKIHPNNTRRVIRALEVYHSSGKTMTQYQENQDDELIYEVALIGLTAEREVLYNRINARVDEMMDNGLLEEVASLYNKGIKDCQSIQAIGYKELYSYLEGKTTLNEAVEQLKQNSRRYAKRQLTWFRNKMDVEWFDMTDPARFEEKAEQIYRYAAGKLQV